MYLGTCTCIHPKDPTKLGLLWNAGVTAQSRPQGQPLALLLAARWAPPRIPRQSRVPVRHQQQARETRAGAGLVCSCGRL